MTKLVIKDLADNIDLDRQAMTAIVGGTRVRGSINPAQTEVRSKRVVDYPNTLPQVQGTHGTKRFPRGK
jgi:hypothetical protein